MATQSLPQHTHHAPTHEPPAAVRATGIILVLTVAIAIVAIAFALPAARSKPHDVPIGAAGPQAASGQVADILEHNAPGAFDITYYPGEAALRDAIRNRDVYGGISLGPDGRTLLVATGGSPTVAQLLSQVGNGIAQHSGVQLRTEDLAPPTADDPRGAGLAASALPITLAGMLPAIALVLVLRREVWTRFTAAVVFAGLAGCTIAALLQYVFGSIDANFWGVAGGLTLGALASGLFMLGLGSRARPRRTGHRRPARAVAGKPVVGLDQCARAVAQRMGCSGSVVATGRERHAAALDGILRWRRIHHGDRRAHLLGSSRGAPDRHCRGA